jgi:hypothetical protein
LLTLSLFPSFTDIVEEDRFDWSVQSTAYTLTFLTSSVTEEVCGWDGVTINVEGGFFNIRGGNKMILLFIRIQDRLELLPVILIMITHIGYFVFI